MRRAVMGSSTSLARRIGAAVLAAAWGLVVGATVAAAFGTVQVLLSPGLEIASTPRAMFLVPIMTMAEGLFWGLLGGAIFVLPVAIAAPVWLGVRVALRVFSGMTTTPQERTSV